MLTRALLLSIALASIPVISPGAPARATNIPSAAAAPPDATRATAFPQDKTVHQSIQLNGRPLNYDATVGSLPVLDEGGQPVARMMFIAYTVPSPNRPVTFVMNGGPGAASVFLNLGGIGPKHLASGVSGISPSDPPDLTDNAGTWLDFTDLVFIDAVGTGFSQALINKDESRKRLYTPSGDVQYLSRFIFDWLSKNERLTSRKYFVGESYGGFRGPRMTYYLQTVLGISLNGVVLISPYLDPHAFTDGDVSPLPWILTLPSIAAAHLERHGELTDARMAEIIAYTRGAYANDLLQGRSDSAALERIVERVTALTGLDATFVRRSGGRIDTRAYVREVYRSEGKLASIIDSNFFTYDPYPFAPTQLAGDPLVDTLIAPYTTAIVDFITHTVGWKYTGRYYSGNMEVFNLWNDGDAHSPWTEGDDVERGSVRELRQAIAVDPKLNILIAHGWNDLDCPFMTSVLINDQLPVMDGHARVQVKEYPGGHMFYSREASQLQFRADVMQLYARH